MYQERIYRSWVQHEGLVPFEVSQAESDLLILAGQDVTRQAKALLAEVREDLVEYIRRDPRFRVTHQPHRLLPGAPLVAVRMAEAAGRFGVGPMAAVAGAIAECVGEQLCETCGEVVVENGGDIYLRLDRQPTVCLYAGEHSPFTRRLRFQVGNGASPLGVCTSSGTVGHSFSRGRADALCVVSRSATLADAAATALANRVQTVSDIESVLAMASADEEILGILVAVGDQLGVWGQVELV